MREERGFASSAKRPIEACAMADSKPVHTPADPSASSADTPQPNYRFVDSRRLTGPNRYFDGPAVTLTPLGAASGDPRALEAGPRACRALARRLGWPDPAPADRAPGHGDLSGVSGAPDELLTATELSEWAWERAAAEGAAAERSAVQPRLRPRARFRRRSRPRSWRRAPPRSDSRRSARCGVPRARADCRSSRTTRRSP